jgi:hypothetical protein
MFELHVVVAGIVMFNIMELIMEIVPNSPTHDVSREWLGESPPFLSYSLMADCNADRYG